MASRSEKLKKLILHGLIMAIGIGLVALAGLKAFSGTAVSSILYVAGALLMFGSYFKGYYWFRKVKDAEEAEKARAEGREVEEKAYKALLKRNKE